ncbi:MAG TPA: hypothetical protein VNZ44_01320 [Pyrinomonadaceae bacterium]|nr:hypothetical protein [Pyrinomonadaceae bacterium]
MSKRKFLASACASLVILTLAGLVAAQVMTGRKVEKRTVTQAELRQQQEEDATPVQAGVMTERQRVHSRLYGGRQGLGKSLREQSEESARAGQGGDVNVTTTPGTPVFSLTPGEKRAPLEEAVGGSDAVVVATVRAKESQLTEDEKYVFTDYEVTVKEVLKDNAASHLSASDVLTVTRPGGKVLLGGHLITVVDEGVKPLTVGDEYLLFLKFIPETGTYAAISEGRSGFKLSHGRVESLSAGAGYARKQEGRDSDSLVGEARAAAAASKVGRENE